MLEFIIGRACTGKSYTVVRDAAKSSEKGKVIIIVPEQFSFETERALVKLENSVTDNIKVLSFSRLYDDITEGMSFGAVRCISDFERIILMKKAVASVKDELKIFSRISAFHSFPSQIADTIRDFKFSAVDSETLMQISKEVTGTLSAKLHDVSLIMSAYDALLSDKFIDSSDRLTKLYKILCEHDYFKSTTVYFDSFSGFTGQQYKIIEKIFEQADKAVFSLSSDNPADNSLNVFYNVNSMYAHICRIAHSRNITDIRVNTLDSSFYSSKEMQSFERFAALGEKSDNMLSNGKISVIACANPREEALAAASVISKEVYENNYRFKDFVMVARNADDYADYVERSCKNAEIACFMDKSVPLSNSPVYIYIRHLLNIAISYDTEEILNLVKTGLFGEISPEQISELEDYVYIWDIKSVAWNDEWTMSVNGLQTDDDSVNSIKKLESINGTRKKITDIICNFKKTFCGTPKKRCAAVFSHLISNKVDKNLSTLCESFENDGNSALAAIVRQSWDAIINVFDSVVRVLDHADVTSEEFIDSFQLAVETATIANIPQMLDEVTFGAADRIRPSKPKISLILGANQGVFPHISDNSGLFCRNDKNRLEKYGVLLDDNAIKSAVEENYLVYSMLCCPVDKVYVLYSLKNMNGEQMEPSAFVKSIESAFNDVKTINFKLSSNGDFMPYTPKTAFCEMGLFDENDKTDIIASLKDCKNSFLRFEKDDICGEKRFEVSSKTAEALFGNELHISPTKFDTYHRCSLSYLLKYGFRTVKLKKADFNVLQRGTIVHYVLEGIINHHKKDLGNISTAQLSAEVDTLINEYLLSVKGSEQFMTPRFAYLVSKISASVKEIVFHIAAEFEQSDFEPKYCELTIGEDGDIPSVKYSLSDGSNVYMDGKIDRVDVYKNNVRVVDYKTGRMEFVLSDTLAGLNMQMLLYLYAFIKNGNTLVESPKPAGILYMPAKKSSNSVTLRMNGLLSDQEELRCAMEKENKGQFVPKYTAASSSYVSDETFFLVFKKIDELIYSMGEKIKKGEFSANPTDTSKQDACKYCDFSSICRSNNIEHKMAADFTNDEVYEILKGECT